MKTLEARCTTEYPITAFGGVDFTKKWRVLPQGITASDVNGHPHLELRVIEEQVKVSSPEKSDEEIVEINATDGAIELALELGIPIEEVETLSPVGRISVKDVRLHAANSS